MAEVEWHALPDTIHPQVFLVMYVLQQDWIPESVLLYVQKLHVTHIIILWMTRIDLVMPTDIFHRYLS